MKIAIPEFCLLAIVGPQLADGVSLAQRHFQPDEIVSHASELWPKIAADRLARRELVVIEASGTTVKEQIDLVRLAKRFHAQPIAIVHCNPASRSDLRIAHSLESTGFRSTHSVTSGEADRLEVERDRLPPDFRDDHGPFDIIGDVHGCIVELTELLHRLGYSVRLDGSGDDRIARVDAPAGRRAIFVGDFVDRGPNSPDVLRIAMAMVEQGQAFAVPGNHDTKFLRWLRGANVRLTHGLELTSAQFGHEGAPFRDAVRHFLLSLPSHLWLEGGRLAVAHAGILEDMIGREAEGVREFCLYGDTDGETDETGLVVRYHWAAGYQGETAVVYGHTPVPDAGWVNNTLCVRHGLRFRRQAHRAQVAGAGGGIGACRPHVRQAGPPLWPSPGPACRAQAPAPTQAASVGAPNLPPVIPDAPQHEMVPR